MCVYCGVSFETEVLPFQIAAGRSLEGDRTPAVQPSRYRTGYLLLSSGGNSRRGKKISDGNKTNTCIILYIYISLVERFHGTVY